MKKIVLVFILLSSFGVKTVLAQNESDTDTSTLNRKQGKANLDAAKGFGDFIFGSPVKSFKNFKYVPDPQEPSKKYVSDTPINVNGIAIKSVSLDFYKNKLFSITIHVDKSQLEKLMSYCLKNYGPKGRDLDDDGTYFWRGNIKKLSFYEIEDNLIEVLFIDNSDSNQRIEAAMKLDGH
jgi:hypothetical protein